MDARTAERLMTELLNRSVVIVVLKGALHLELDAVEQLAIHADSAAAPREAVLDRSLVIPQEHVGLHADLRLDADRLAEANRAIVPLHAGLDLLFASSLLSRCRDRQRQHDRCRSTE